MAEIREEPLQPQEEELEARVTKLLQLPSQSEEALQLLQNPHPKPKIQTVPVFLRRKNPNFVKYCSPTMISFGPIHHHLDDTDLKLGQQFKTCWENIYLGESMDKIEDQSGNSRRQCKKDKVSLYEVLTINVWKMKYLFHQDVIQDYNDGQLADMLFVDGCALLYFMDTVDEQHPEKLNLKLDQLMYIWRDIILLENQLPMEFLELLKGDSASDLPNSFYNFLFMGLTRRDRDLIFTWSDEHKPAHLLDYIRLFHTSSLSSPVARPSLLDRSIRFFIRLYKKEETLPLGQEVPSHRDEPFREEDLWHRYKNIRDLRNVGIQVEASNSEWKWSNISFTSKWFSGQLMLPGIVVDDVAPYFYFNMIAFEMLPDFPNNFEFCSYFSLTDSLIDDAEDVKELRLAGVLQNLLGSDEEVAKLFNELGGILPTKMFNYTTRKSVVAYNNTYIEIKQEIDKHYRNKWKTWRAQLRTTYFNNPWSAIFCCCLGIVSHFCPDMVCFTPKQNS